MIIADEEIKIEELRDEINLLLEEVVNLRKSISRLAMETNAIRRNYDRPSSNSNYSNIVNSMILGDISTKKFYELGTNIVKNIVKNNLTGLRERGGPVSPSGSYLVGENGPEIFTPNASGRIKPTSKQAKPIKPKFYSKST